MKLKESICSLFKNAFDWRTPIDKIIDLTGKKYVAVWNGVTNKREFLLDEKGDKHNVKSQLIGIGFGRWVNDETCESTPVVALYIDSTGRVIHNCVALPYQLESRDMELYNKCCELGKLIKENCELDTKYKKIFDEWIKHLFEAPPAVRYRRRIFMEDILNPKHTAEAITIWQSLIDSTNEYNRKKK